MQNHLLNYFTQTDEADRLTPVEFELVWSALNYALETAKFSISGSEIKEIATWISHKAAQQQ